jgi:hypothetical protein
VVFAPALSSKLKLSLEPFDVIVGYWEPSPDVIDELEARLPAALEAGLAKPESLSWLPTSSGPHDDISWQVPPALLDILPHYWEFRRQYVGIIVKGGARRVLANSFSEVTTGREDEFPRWRDQWVKVLDGGWGFWQIQYDVATHRFLDFAANGYA